MSCYRTSASAWHCGKHQTAAPQQFGLNLVCFGAPWASRHPERGKDQEERSRAREFLSPLPARQGMPPAEQGSPLRRSVCLGARGRTARNGLGQGWWRWACFYCEFLQLRCAQRQSDRREQGWAVACRDLPCLLIVAGCRSDPRSFPGEMLARRRCSLSFSLDFDASIP